MNADLKQLLDRAPNLEGNDLKETIEEIKKGKYYNLGWLVDDLLEMGASKDMLCWARDLYLWATKNVDVKFNVEVIRLNHEIDPALVYTRAEVKQLLKYNTDLALHAYVCLAKAILSDNTLYKDYHWEVEQFFQKIIKDHDLDACATVDITPWWHLTHLHPQFSSTIEHCRSFVRSLSEQFDDMTDPLLATKYLDYAYEFAEC